MFTAQQTGTGKEGTAGLTCDFSDTDAMTYAALGAGAVTLGGSAFIASLVFPGQLVGGTVLTGGLAAAAVSKQQTGKYLPFLSKDKKDSEKSASDKDSDSKES